MRPTNVLFIFSDQHSRILKGARPGDLPIEQPSTYEVVLNLKTAKQLGISVAQSFLIRVDRVIQ